MTIQYDYTYWKSIRFEKETRYYVLALEQDLFGSWVITKANGRINSALGKIAHEPCQSYDQACERLETLTQYRIKRWHYKIASAVEPIHKAALS